MPVVGTATDQILVDSIVELEQPAVKIDEIRAVIRDATCTVISNKVIFQGVLHKQIFFVREPDNIVVHQAEDIPFSGFVDVPGAAPNNTCEVTFEIAFIEFNLLNSDQLRQKVLIDVAVTVFDGAIPVPVNGGIPVPVNGGAPGGEVPVQISGTPVRARQQQPTPVYVQGARSRGRSSWLSTNPNHQGTGKVVFKAVQKVPVREFIARP
ncbi:MAG: DUF3794 domain-containing protein [Firmicutes bacterium]|nr:DUF3794 domain-containing protein [Bacillota bacterium]